MSRCSSHRVLGRKPGNAYPPLQLTEQVIRERIAANEAQLVEHADNPWLCEQTRRALEWYQARLAETQPAAPPAPGPSQDQGD